MSEIALKPGWTRVRFGDVVRLNTERCADPAAAGIERYVGIEHIEPQDLRIRSWGLVADGTTFTNLFRLGQVLFAKRRAYQRKVALADFEGVCSGDIYVFEPSDDRLLPDLLPFLCQTEGFFAHALSTSAGSLSPRTNWQQLAQYEFALPPLEEQRRIAEVLLALLADQETTAVAIDAARKLGRALAVHTFELDRSTQRKLGSVIADSRYGPRFSSGLYHESGAVAQLRTTDLDDEGNLSYASAPRARLDPDAYAGHLLQDGDIIISRSGTCGLTAVFREQATPTIPGAFLIRLRTTDEMAPEYLHEFFLSPAGRQLTSSLSRGGVQKNLSGSELLAQLVPCPSSSRQREAVRLLASSRGIVESLRRREGDITELRKRILLRLWGQR